MNYTYIAILFISFNHCTIQTTTSPWYLAMVEKTSLSYKNKCKLITLVQSIKKASLITKNVLTNQSYQNIEKEIAQKRLSIKNKYLTKETLLINELEKSLDFSKEIWLQCLQTITKIKQLIPQQPIQKSIVHDPVIPKDQMTIIKTLLENNTINPDTVTIVRGTTDDKELFACAGSTLHYTYSPESTQFIINPHVTQKITLYDNITNEPVSNQLAICAHEVEHLCLQHSITLSVIEQYMQHYHNKGREFLENNKNWQNLKIIYEAQAEIFSALKSPEIAQALVDLRAKKYYPDHLYEAHYHDLVEINTLWKMEKFLGKLQKFTSNSVENLIIF